jgi:hypothetical protein
MTDISANEPGGDEADPSHDRLMSIEARLLRDRVLRPKSLIDTDSAAEGQASMRAVANRRPGGVLDWLRNDAKYLARLRDHLSSSGR